MKAARFRQVNKPLSLEDIPAPSPGPGQVLIRVRACGICGSDIHIVYEGVTPTAFTPITLGHEPAGEVAEVGPEVEGFKPGDRVAVCPFIVCGQCRNCREGRHQICLKRICIGIQANGALAEYLLVPAANLVPLPPQVPFEQGAIITDAVATPWHALTVTGRLKAGETVAVFGCGGLGIHGVKLARLAGAALVVAVDVHGPALERALAAGADAVVNAAKEDAVQAIKDLSHGGVDLSLELVGLNASIAQAVDSLRVGGRAVVAGLGPEPITVSPPVQFVRQEAALLGSYGFTVSETAELVGLVATGRLNLADSVSLTLPLTEVNQGLDRLHKKIGDPVRIVIIP
jgi:2-desacetyl-2-hydroxyethyl bacteriochlorophyllide A dehydrogenase